MKKDSFIAALLGLWGIYIAISLSVTLYKYPLFDWAVEDIDWVREWLYTTVLDYYGSTSCLCVIVLLTEENLLTGILWSLGFCLLGSPICVLYTVLRLIKKSVVMKEYKNHYNELKDIQMEIIGD